MKTALSKRGIIYTSFKYGTFEGYWLETIVNLISQDVTACQSGIRFSDYLQKINMWCMRWYGTNRNYIKSLKAAIAIIFIQSGPFRNYIEAETAGKDFFIFCRKIWNRYMTRQDDKDMKCGKGDRWRKFLFEIIERRTYIKLAKRCLADSIVFLRWGLDENFSGLVNK